MERFRTGDLQESGFGERLRKHFFSEPQRLGELAERVDRAAQRLKTASSNGSGLSHMPRLASTVKR